MLETAIIFQSKKFKLYEEDNDSFIPGKDMAIFLLQKLQELGLHLVHGVRETIFGEREVIDNTCYYHFELKDESDALEFYVNLVRFGSPAQDYWSIQFNKHISFLKSISKPRMMYCFSPAIITKMEAAVREIEDVKNLQRLTDEQYSALLIA